MISEPLWNTALEVGGIAIKNRIAFPPLSGNWAHDDGSVSKKVLRFYDDMGKGGAGMVIVAGTAVSVEGKGSDHSLCLYNEDHLPGFKELASRILNHDCLTLIQLMHVGGQGNPDFMGHTPVSPSGLKCKPLGFETKELAGEEIERIRDDFINSACLAERAGFQGVELHLAHGYLLHEFISCHTNKREDVYGGPLENRLRLVLEIIAGIKKRSPKLIVGVRISGDDYLDDGINEKVSREYLPILENAGVEYFSITAGIYETSKYKHEAMEKGEFFRYSRGVKSIVAKPVIGVGKILNLDMAEEHLSRGDCDIAAIGRGLVADPFMIKKVLNGQDVDYCTECGECQYLRHGKTELNCPLNEATCLLEEEF